MLSTCPECGAEYPDYYSPVGSVETFCDACGYSSEPDEGQITYTYREYLVLKAVLATQCSMPMGFEAVASIAIEHPEWDMDGEQKSWTDWEATSSHPPTSG